MVFYEELMPSRPAINDRLILEAQRLGRHRTKKETVTVALGEYIQRLKQQEIVSLFGTIDYGPDTDYRPAKRMNRN
jgi:Bacterial antitoxin of type II TA system, VapB